MSKATGARYERELATLLSDLGYGVVRTPSSGSATARDLPDLLVGSEEWVPVVTDPKTGEHAGATFTDAWACELKSGKDTTLYVDGDEVAALREFASAFGATPYLVARFTTQATDTAYYFVRPDKARQTDGGFFGLPVDGIEQRASMVFYP